MFSNKTNYYGKGLISAPRYISFHRECIAQSKKKLIEHMNLAIYGTLLSLNNIEVFPKKISFRKSDCYYQINGTNNVAADVTFKIEYYDYLKDGKSCMSEETHKQIIGDHFLDKSIKRQPLNLKLYAKATKKQNDSFREICVLADSRENALKQLKDRIVKLFSYDDITKLSNAEIELINTVHFSECENGIEAKCRYRTNLVKFLEELEEDEDR